MIEFENVCKQYPDGTKGLDDVSFTVEKGQFCVLLGPSGAGKTTLLKVINGLQAATGGRIKVEDKTLTPQTLKPIQMQTAMIHQHFNLVGRLSVEANVLVGAIATLSAWRIFLSCYPKDLRRRAAMLVEEVGLEEKHFRRRAAELSGGQQQRVGIARAFLLSPALVLADEPVASLDPAISEDVLEALRNAALENGTTVLCSLHQVDLAIKFADRIIGMRQGKVVFDGTPQQMDVEAIAKLYRGSNEQKKQQQ